LWGGLIFAYPGTGVDGGGVGEAAWLSPFLLYAHFWLGGGERGGGGGRSLCGAVVWLIQVGLCHLCLLASVVCADAAAL